MLAARYPDARRIDLLRTDDYVRYLQRPSLLRDELRDAAHGTLTVIDEIQKVPALLDEVHWLIEHQRLVNFQNIARECAVSSPTVKEYYQILVDTLLGRFLPAFTARPKRRVIQAPKFYFADVGVVNHLAQRGTVAPGGELFGKALENLICHELRDRKSVV